ncbi:unnamed protein product, partial [Dibothriocephalus latus]
MEGLTEAKAMELAERLGFSSDQNKRDAAEYFRKLYELFMTFDDNSESRQPEIFKLRDWSQMDERD